MINIAGARCGPEKRQVERVIIIWRDRKIITQEECADWLFVLQNPDPRIPPGPTELSLPPWAEGAMNSSPAEGDTPVADSPPPKSKKQFLTVPEISNPADPVAVAKAMGPPLEPPAAEPRVGSASLENLLDDMIFRRRVTLRLATELPEMPDSITLKTLNPDDFDPSVRGEVDQQLLKHDLFLRHLVLCAAENRAMRKPVIERLQHFRERFAAQRREIQTKLEHLDMKLSRVRELDSAARERGVPLYLRPAASPISSPKASISPTTAVARGAPSWASAARSRDSTKRSTRVLEDESALLGDSDEDDEVLALRPVKRQRSEESVASARAPEFHFDPDNPNAGKRLVWNPILRQMVPEDEIIQTDEWRD